MRLHRKETVKRLSFLNYRKLINKGHLNNHDFSSFKNTSKEARWSCVVFTSTKMLSKMYIKMMSLIRPSKLHQKITSKRLKIRWYWRANLTCWVCWYNRTKIILVSNQNHNCFKVKFWRWFTADKLTLFRRWNTVIFSTLI